MRVEWKFKNDAPMQGSSDGFWYDLANGYVKPEAVLADADQVAMLRDAQHLLQGFERAMEAAGLVNEF